MGPRDYRKYLPRFSEANRANNERIVAAFRAFAEERGMTPGQLAVSWARAKEPGFVPLIGAKTRARWNDAIGALEHPLSPADVQALEEAIPPDAIAGTRYGAEQMKHLDSER